MDEVKLIDYGKIALSVAKEAGKFLINNFGPIKKATHKTDYHFGIDDDIKLNTFYEEKLKELTPEASLYTEEGEKSLENDLVWVIDPIDGTSNYRVGNPFYVTQICLLFKNQPVVSVVFAPSLNQLFTAVKGKGAFLNGQKVEMSPESELKNCLISIGKGTKFDDILWYGGILKNIIEHVRTFRNYGSSGLGLAYTAAGKIDIYMNKGAELYDFAPGALLVREAGGEVTDFNGNDWNLNEESLLASNSILNKEIRKILNA